MISRGDFRTDDYVDLLHNCGRSCLIYGPGVDVSRVLSVATWRALQPEFQLDCSSLSLFQHSEQQLEIEFVNYQELETRSSTSFSIHCCFIKQLLKRQPSRVMQLARGKLSLSLQFMNATCSSSQSPWQALFSLSRSLWKLSTTLQTIRRNPISLLKRLL